MPLSLTTRTMELVAKYFHILWTLLCLYTAANYCYAAVLCYPIASSYGGVIGLVFKQNIWACVGQIIFALFGTLWHVYGAHLHVVAIHRIDSPPFRGPLTFSSSTVAPTACNFPIDEDAK